ncbi:MAG TPA: helix-turn-helix domain-containing protein [Kofleriaceae bacterium]|nr:helix-turn-helix domain-containing protein [Kofleriaceae bacterium]
MRCPNCKSVDSFRPWEGTMKLRGVEFLARGEKCRECGEIVFDSSEVRRQERVVAAGLVERGIRTGRDFQYVRKVAGLKATELAELLDVRPETVSRWERDEVDIPRPIAFTLGELFERPRILRDRLEAFAHRR